MGDAACYQRKTRAVAAAVARWNRKELWELCDVATITAGLQQTSDREGGGVWEVASSWSARCLCH